MGTVQLSGEGIEYTRKRSVCFPLSAPTLRFPPAFFTDEYPLSISFRQVRPSPNGFLYLVRWFHTVGLGPTFFYRRVWRWNLQ